MRKLSLVAAAAAAFVAVPAMAQDMNTTDAAAPAPAADTVTAPDGTRAFGIEPYVAIMGGWEQFDRQTVAGIPAQPKGYNLDGALVEGIVGFNVPLGPVFVGAEGAVAKGVSGDIDWQYGAYGRAGFRAGESGLFYGKVGYRWNNFHNFAPGVAGDLKRDYHATVYGVGAEVGPKDIGLGGLTGNSGLRLRMEVSTFDNAHSFRPMAGVVAHF
ncbi:opacity protein [Sphingomonas sp. Sph1(2015)]|jgi:outer membrane immunogenic protein|uniref:opacity protein n=1 Tax=Sphingomonas sp. Sph1(2015) TaxID=1628084 RepID=UPI00097709E1|nr:opacity protein [Sphingomonas sp. Sph1(2015)]OMJ31141.1 opacity protein [Sphingomonas sp. Sph1(2015)]